MIPFTVNRLAHMASKTYELQMKFQRRHSTTATIFRIEVLVLKRFLLGSKKSPENVRGLMLPVEVEHIASLVSSKVVAYTYNVRCSCYVLLHQYYILLKWSLVSLSSNVLYTCATRANA